MTYSIIFFLKDEVSLLSSHQNSSNRVHSKIFYIKKQIVPNIHFCKASMIFHPEKKIKKESTKLN